jgi:hypothetical protein
MRFNRILRCIPKNPEIIVVNENMKKCYFCKHYDMVDKKCRKFAGNDYVTDIFYYGDARYCRDDETKCGKQAKYYEELTESQHNKKSVFAIIKLFRVPLGLFGGVWLYIVVDKIFY